jgi:hypothetical protein
MFSFLEFIVSCRTLPHRTAVLHEYFPINLAFPTLLFVTCKLVTSSYFVFISRNTYMGSYSFNNKEGHAGHITTDVGT